MAQATDLAACFEEPLPAAFSGLDPAATKAAVGATLTERGVMWGADAGPFRVDPVPRVISAAEWEPLATGLIQRVKALECFVADVYGRQRIVRDGVLDATAIASARVLRAADAAGDPLASGASSASPAWTACADPDGTFLVLEDNVRTPSGLSYTAAARAAVTAHVEPPDGLLPVDPFTALGDVLRAAAPEGVEHPVIAVVSDGPANVAYYDHLTMAERLGIPLVRVDQLSLRDGHLYAGPVRIDVAYRRTDEDRLSDPRGGLTDIGQLLFEPWSQGNLGLINAFGTGVADDKLLHGHVESMIRYYLVGGAAARLGGDVRPLPAGRDAPRARAARGARRQAAGRPRRCRGRARTAGERCGARCGRRRRPRRPGRLRHPGLLAAVGAPDRDR